MGVGGFSDPSYQHLGSGLLTLSSCGQLGWKVPATTSSGGRWAAALDLEVGRGKPDG